jgi:hypothetical protein
MRTLLPRHYRTHQHDARQASEDSDGRTQTSHDRQRSPHRGRDLAYAVSRYSSDLRSIHWAAVKRIIRYLARTLDFGIVLGGHRNAPTLESGPTQTTQATERLADQRQDSSSSSEGVQSFGPPVVVRRPSADRPSSPSTSLSPRVARTFSGSSSSSSRSIIQSQRFQSISTIKEASKQLRTAAPNPSGPSTSTLPTSTDANSSRPNVGNSRVSQGWRSLWVGGWNPVEAVGPPSTQSISFLLSSIHS